MNVAPLEWKLEEENWWSAETPFCFGYEVRKTERGEVRFRIGRDKFESFDGSVEEAKLTCFLDFANKIYSVIEDLE